MKTRLGFVSNSSSSSFVLGARGPLKAALKEIEENEKASKSLFSSFAHEIVAIIASSCQEFKERDALNDFGCETLDEFYKTDEGKDIKRLRDKGFKVYTGTWCDESSPIERLLCEMDLHYESDNLVIIHEGGY